MRTRRCRGIRPIGDSEPCGVTRVITSPGNDDNEPLSALPMRIPAKSSSVAGFRSVTSPAVIDLPMSVTPLSSSGSMPLTVMKPSPRSLVTSALPRMAGAAPATPGNSFIFATSAR